MTAGDLPYLDLLARRQQPEHLQRAGAGTVDRHNNVAHDHPRDLSTLIRAIVEERKPQVVADDLHIRRAVRKKRLLRRHVDGRRLALSAAHRSFSPIAPVVSGTKGNYALNKCRGQHSSGRYPACARLIVNFSSPALQTNHHFAPAIPLRHERHPRCGVA